MTEEVEIYEISISPTPQNSVASIKRDTSSMIRDVLREEGLEDLLSKGEIQVHFSEEAFGGEEVVKILIEHVAPAVASAAVATSIKFALDKIWKFLEDHYSVKPTYKGKKKKHS